MIKWSKKEGGRGRVLWIENSGVHPGSGLEHGRSAQQELQWGVWAGDASYVPLGRQSRHHLGGTYLRTILLRAQLARATRGCARVLLAVRSETVASQDTRTGGSEVRDAIIGSALQTRGFTSGSGAFLAQSRLPEWE